MTNIEPAGDRSPRLLSSDPAAARPAGLAGQVQLRAATPEAVLAVVPHMLGFYPSHSLVVLGLGERSRVVVTFRYDLPAPPDDGLSDDIASHAGFVLQREGIAAALLVGYGPADLVEPVALRTAVSLSRGNIHLQELLRADGGRYWSLLCDDAACCPPEGRLYDPGSHPAAAVMADAGLAAQPDRDSLARTLQRPAGTADTISRATSQGLARLARLVELGEDEGDRDPQLRATRVGRREVQRAIRRYRRGRRIASVEHLAWLAVLLSDIRVRDDAWARMHPAYYEQHRQLWTDVLRSAALDYVPAPASLLAFTAWQAGNGALAAMAVDRALGADPAYSMAHLLSGALEAALPPSAAKIPMTPAAVAASYAAGPAGPADSRGGQHGGRRGAGRSGGGQRDGQGGSRQRASGQSGGSRRSSSGKRSRSGRGRSSRGRSSRCRSEHGRSSPAAADATRG